MRRILLLGISLSLMAFLGVSLVGAHMPHDRRDHHDGPQGFDGQLGQMDIIGTVNVTDAIVITLTIQPSADAQAQMQQRADRRPGNHHPLPENITNTMMVKIDKLVEFIDINNNGFDVNDTVVSTYALDSTNLGQPVLSQTINGSLYTITSNDNSFVMYLYLNENDGVPHSWKWSVLMNYNFQSSNSNLAITQSVISNGGRPIAGNLGVGQGNELPPNAARNCELVDNHATIPMFFKWANNATVDGQVLNVTATTTDTGMAITIPQGRSIFYDPEIGVNIATLEGANTLVGNLLASFADSVSSPIIFALATSTVIIAAIVVLRRRV